MKTLNQVWNDYQQEAKRHRIEEYGSDPLEPKTIFNPAMRLLAAQPSSLFIGQGVGEGGDGVSMWDDFDGIPMGQRQEWPVAEELQMGYGTGLAMMGYLPILQYPRIDFMLRALDSLVNHLDKMEEMTRGQWKPKVIIRTRVGSKKPLNAGPQHTNNHTTAFRLMLTNVNVLHVQHQTDILSAYQHAIQNDQSTLVVEDLG